MVLVKGRFSELDRSNQLANINSWLLLKMLKPDKIQQFQHDMLFSQDGIFHNYLPPNGMLTLGQQRSVASLTDTATRQRVTNVGKVVINLYRKRLAQDFQGL